jgi:hypothetical protein
MRRRWHRLIFRIRVRLFGCPVCTRHVEHLTFCRYGMTLR